MVPFGRIALVLLIAHSLSHSQTSWQWLNPLPQGYNLFGVQRISPDTIVAVGSEGTFIKSTNAGKSWSVQYRIGGTSAGLRAVEFVTPEIGYTIGTNGTILRTNNGGISWNQQSSGTDQYLYGMDFLDADHGFVVGASGTILYTSNGGASWISQPSGTSNELRGVSFPAPGVATVVGRSPILRTTNAGTTWSAQTAPAGLPHYTMYAVDFTDANTGTAIGEAGVPIRTTNGGTTWIAQPSPVTSPMISISFSSQDNGTAVEDFGGKIIRTYDGGASWNIQPHGYPVSLKGVSFCDIDHGAAVGIGGMILLTSDAGGVWYRPYPGLHQNLTNVHFLNADTGIAVGYRGDNNFNGMIFRTTNGGRNWTGEDSSSGYMLTGVHFSDPTHGTAVGGMGMVRRTTNGGDTWTAQTSGTTGTLSDVHFTGQLTGYCAGSDITTGLILKTTDGGSSWAPTTLPDLPILYSIAFSPANPNLGIATGYVGAIVRTTDAGTSWTQIASPTFGSLEDVAFADSALVIAVGRYAPCLRSADGGLTWSDVSPVPNFDGMSVAFETGGTGIVVGAGGTWRSSDLGLTWQQWSNRTSPLAVAIGVTGGKRIVYGVGSHGAVSCAVLSPLVSKVWTGAVDTLWENDGNWFPAGVPTKADSVVIPHELNQPILGATPVFPVIASLTILSGARLTIADSSYFIVIKGNVNVLGTLEVRPAAVPVINVGGGWYSQPVLSGLANSVSSDEGFIPSNSTVSFSGQGSVNDIFHNIVFDSISQMTTSGNIIVQNRCDVRNVLYLLPDDTLFIMDDDTVALYGSGMIPTGTIVRSIAGSPGGVNRFESDKTSIVFTAADSIPTRMVFTTRPDSVADSASVSTMVHRFYELSADGGVDFTARLSLRYNPAELPPGLGQQELKILWLDTTDGADLWKGVPSSVDTTLHVVVAENVTHLSKWALGRPKANTALTIFTMERFWNLVSLPIDPPNDSVSALFSGSYAGPYGFSSAGGYAVSATLEPGRGYWMKFDAPVSFPIGGVEIIIDTLQLVEGWNLVGTLSYPMAVDKIYPLATSMGLSPFYGYAAGYVPADTLQRGKGYWVKADRAGRIVLSAFRAAEPRAGRLRFVHDGESPPPPPDVDEPTNGQIPLSFALGRNYPNPFNPITVIRYQLPVREYVRLTVYNVLGQPVATLVNGGMEAGYHAVSFDASTLPSGCYLYRLSAGRFTDTKKMLLIR